jgi:ligand-binding SRPBCC domain-containing protein
MRFRLESILVASAEEVWARVQRTELLREVAGPILVFRPDSPGSLPRYWPVGSPLRLRMYLFGILPLGTHEIIVERIDDRARQLETRERGALLRRWEHVIRVVPAGAQARLIDEVELDAGRLTPVVGSLGQLLFLYRHHRWRAVARRQEARVHDRTRAH